MSVAARRRASGSKRYTELAARVTTAPGPERDELEIENPATGRPLGTVPRCTAEDAQLAVTRGRAAQDAWARDQPLGEGAAPFLRLHDLVIERQDEVLDLIQLESGKARRHAFEEVLDVALVARYYARYARRLLRTRRRRGAFRSSLPPGSTTTRSAWSVSSRPGTIRCRWRHRRDPGARSPATPW